MSPTVPRLKRRAQFLKVARSGRRWAAPGLVLQAFDRGSDGTGKSDAEMRAGFTVSRKVGNAVVRNRARRRLKAAAEQVLPNTGQAGYDYVLIGRGSTVDRPFPALIGDLQAALTKIASGKTQGKNQRPRHKPADTKAIRRRADGEKLESR